MRILNNCIYNCHSISCLVVHSDDPCPGLPCDKCDCNKVELKTLSQLKEENKDICTRYWLFRQLEKVNKVVNSKNSFTQ